MSSLQSSRKLSSSAESKSKKNVTLKTRESCFFMIFLHHLSRKHQMQKSVKKKRFNCFGKFPSIFLTSVSRRVSQKLKVAKHLCSQNAFFLLKIEGGSFGLIEKSWKVLKNSIDTLSVFGLPPTFCGKKHTFFGLVRDSSLYTPLGRPLLRSS